VCGEVGARHGEAHVSFDRTILDFVVSRRRFVNRIRNLDLDEEEIRRK
jgi:hypothetical protein